LNFNDNREDCSFKYREAKVKKIFNISYLVIIIELLVLVFVSTGYVQTLLSAPTLVSPDSGATVSAPVTFIWNSVSGAASYRLQVATTPDFSTILHDSIGIDTSQIVSSINPVGGGDYWRVRASSSSGDSEWSSVWGIITGDITSAIKEKLLIAIPTEYQLYQNYLNPFNSETIIKYQLPKNSYVEILIYNILGQKVRTLVSNNMNPGYYSNKWNGTNVAGETVSSGIYLIRLKTNDFVQTRKMMYLR